MADLRTFQAWEDCGLQCLARVENWDGDLILQADLGTITYKVFDTTTNTETGTGSLTVANVIFDTAQTNSGWPASFSAGFNFKFLLPATAFPIGDRHYRIEFLVTPTSSQPFPIVFRAFAQNLLTS